MMTTITGGTIGVDCEIILRRGAIHEQARTMRMILRTFKECGVPNVSEDDWDYWPESDWSSDLGRVFAFKINADLDADTLRSVLDRIGGVWTREETDDDDALLAELEECGDATLGILDERGIIPAVSLDFAEGWGDMTYEPLHDLIASMYVGVTVSDEVSP